MPSLTDGIQIAPDDRHTAQTREVEARMVTINVCAVARYESVDSARLAMPDRSSTATMRSSSPSSQPGNVSRDDGGHAEVGDRLCSGL